MRRGYYGIGIWHGKTETNIGTLWRSAWDFGASFIFTVGRRYKKQASDTQKTWRHIPLWHFASLDELRDRVPYSARLICIELTETSYSLPNFAHPQRAIYLLGAEDHGLPERILADNICLRIPTARPFCLNVAIAGSLVMYDRFIKAGIA